jgi:3-keto-L-gulonate-6-phosphate decarboxylase
MTPSKIESNPVNSANTKSEMLKESKESQKEMESRTIMERSTSPQIRNFDKTSSAAVTIHQWLDTQVYDDQWNCYHSSIGGHPCYQM